MMSRACLNNFIFAGLLAISAAMVASCRSKLDVETKSGAPAAPATDAGVPDSGETDGAMPPVPPAALPPDSQTSGPVVPAEVSGAVFVEGAKAYFQSTEPIVIRIKRNLFEGGESFSVLNMTNSGTDDTKAVVLVDAEAPQEVVRTDEEYEIVETNSEYLAVRFLPSARGWQGRFFYSLTQPNRVEVVSHSSTTPRYSLVEIYLYDFNVFSLLPTTIDGAGSEDGALRLWLDPVRSRAVRASDGSVLMHGLNAAVFSN
jgi:hypothetical protein